MNTFFARNGWRLATCTLMVSAALSAPLAGAAVNDQDILNDAKTPGDVVSYGMGPQGQRFSPLTKLNTSTVKKLVPAWSFSFGGEKQRGQHD